LFRQAEQRVLHEVHGKNNKGERRKNQRSTSLLKSGNRSGKTNNRKSVVVTEPARVGQVLNDLLEFWLRCEWRCCMK
jgi:hypothetical protein